MSDQQIKNNSSTINWAIRGIAGAAFVLVGILYNNERSDRMELEATVKEVTIEMGEIESDLQNFQKLVIKDYVTNNDFKESKEILLDINSSLSELVSRLIKIETKIELQEN